MSFRIHTQSPELKRELESRLAELEGQLDDGVEYEITAQSLPRDQALESAEGVAEQLGANSIFLSAGLFTVEHAPEQEDPDFAMGLPTISDEKRTAEGGTAEQTENPEKTSAQEIRSPRIDAQKLRDAAHANASHARATLQRAGERASSSLKVAGERTGEFMHNAGAWAAQKTSESKTIGNEIRSFLAARSAQWRTSIVEWNAQHQERRIAEMKARQERQRAAHREAEFAAISAQIMLERQRNEDKARTAKVSSTQPPRPPLRAKIQSEEQRDMWPVWRNAFVTAACLAVVGVIVLAGSGKQSSATPASSTELSQPAVVVPSHSVERPKPHAITTPAVARVPQKNTAARPLTRKHIALSEDEDDGFQEVTVRHYPNASPLAPPKKNTKGVVQISDME